MPIIADVTASSGPTLDELVTEIVTTAQGYAVSPDKMVTLAAGITPTALTMTVTGDCSPGVFEIGDELILVTAVNPQTGTCTIHPRGRGWLGSTPADHLAGDVVAEGPTLPRSRATTAVNDVIGSLFPQLFGIGTATATLTDTLLELPADAEDILDVRTLEDGEWLRVRHWEAENASGYGTTGKTVRVPRVRAGTTVRVVYATRPEPFATADQQWSTTGLPAAIKDLVVLGVLARFAMVLDLGRLTDRFSTPRGDAQQPQLGSGFAMARQIRADYQATLDREAVALRKQYPARTHFVR